MIKERRSDPRIEARLPICYRGTNRLGMERRGDGFVTNLSKAGLLVALASDQRREQARLMIALPHPDGGWFELPAVVVRSLEWGFAVRFDSLDSPQQLNLTTLLESVVKEAMASTRVHPAPTTPKPRAAGK